jgi:hypothetical protein
MALPQPINLADASDQVKDIYTDIKDTFELPYVPLLFRYLGNYPLFLERLWPTLKSNIQDPIFKDLLATLNKEAIRSTQSLIIASPEMRQVTHKLVPAQVIPVIASEIEKYFIVQLKLSFIAIIMRERTKGWAIGAKFLPDVAHTTSYASDRTAAKLHSELHEMIIAETASALSVRDDIREPLLKFILYIHEEFISVITREEYVFTRVQFEKILTHHVGNVPHPIFASYNEVFKSIPDNRDLGNVFYFLSEKFPVSQTIAALMWAMSMQVLKE